MIRPAQRYHGIAICLHWLMALLIFGMLLVGAYMVGLDDSDPLRYSLTQWHKSFGVVALLLIVWRILWRLTHSAPPMPSHLKSWEKDAANLTHIALYLVVLVIPMSGWIMVSASPLELPTLLFNKILWPHLPLFDTLPNKDGFALLFADVHTLAGYLLMLLLVAHIGAALRHHFVLRDGVMERMLPRTSDGTWVAGVRSTAVVILFGVVSLMLYGFSGGSPVPLEAGKNQVRFEFTVMDETQEGMFSESTVDMLIDPAIPTDNRLQATVNTAEVDTGNSQIDTTLISEDWFDSDNYPQAMFDSRKLLPLGENSYSVSGVLRIKDVAHELSFPVNLVDGDDKRIASGRFVINRLDFNLGRDSQPDDETVGYPVTITFKFEVR